MTQENTAIIHGSLGQVYEYAAAVEKWPEFLNHYREVEVLEPGDRERLVRMACVRKLGFINWPCKWVAKQFLDPEGSRIRFSHVSGPAKGMDVEWILKAAGDGVSATIRHEVSSKGAWRRLWFDVIVGPYFISNIAAKTLAGIDAFAEKGEKCKRES